MRNGANSVPDILKEQQFEIGIWGLLWRLEYVETVRLCACAPKNSSAVLCDLYREFKVVALPVGVEWKLRSDIECQAMKPTFGF